MTKEGSMHLKEKTSPRIRGPVQVLVIGFEGNHFTGKIMPELQRLQRDGLLNVLDLLVVIKDDGGQVHAVEVSGVNAEERMEFGALAGALVGLGAAGEVGMEEGALAGALDMADGAFDERDIWTIEESIPKDSAAAIAILEHRWAIPLRDRIVDAGGVALADAWLHPRDLIAAGARMAEQAPRQGDEKADPKRARASL